MAEQIELFHPSCYTTDIGTPVWFAYTRSQWMRAVICQVGRRFVVVKPAEGQLERRLKLRWVDVRWHKPIY